MSDTINFGDWLKNKRSEKKISLEEIAAVTKVHIGQLKALENNDRRALPAAAFIRGFIVSYARHLGLEENEVLQRYKDSDLAKAFVKESPMPQVARLAQTPTHPQVKIVTSPQFEESPVSAKPDPEKKIWTPQRILVSTSACLFLVGLIFLINIGRQSKNHKAPSVPTSESVEVPDSHVSEKTSTNLPPSTATAATPSTSLATESVGTKAPSPQPALPTNSLAASPAAISQNSLEIRAIEKSFVNVRIDDERSKGFPMLSGTLQHFQVARKVQLALSNAGVIELAWNGVWYQAPGYRGDVKTLILPDHLALLKVKGSENKVKKVALKKKEEIKPALESPASATPTVPKESIPPHPTGNP